ncbi:MAG: ABC transporter substrate-binding protein [Betaproteobacteria bacterium]|nr:ABC transporter substrate-binding protein [Betaproteobacteria bacterium]
MNKLIALVVAGCCIALPAGAADKLKIGFMSTLSGPGAALGIDARDAMTLYHKLNGGKIGGLPAELVIADDQVNPDMGKQVVERMIKRDKVDIMTGVIFSNVLYAIGPTVFQEKMFYLSNNAGPNDWSGDKCNPYFFGVAWQSEDVPGAMGTWMNDKGFKNVYLLAPNYPGGRENISGFKRYWKGKIVDEVYTRMGQLDFAAELAAMRAAKPEAVFIFMPGGMGINFIKQFVAAGMSKDIQLVVPGYSADEDTIKALGETLLGAFNSSHWAHDLDNAENKRFVAAFEKEYKRLPSMFAAQGWDTIALMDAAVRDVKGKIEDKAAFRKALEAANFKSVRGAFKFNKNHMPIHDLYMRVVSKDAKGRITNKTMGKIVSNFADPFAASCKMPAL